MLARRFLLAATALSFAALAPADAQPVAVAPVASDLPADPAVRMGRLANGMRYSILKNATPPGEASLRLRIDAGSLDEREDQRGIAHFLEHMVLNGTKNVPEGEFVRRLERAGLRFGPDTNASTDFEQTVFKLDLPRADAATVDEAMFLLREVADEALLATSAIDSERGIIQSEERTRNTPGYRAALDEYGYMLRGQLLPTRFPIGDPDVIRTAPRERFAEFYNGFYRPERATLVAVGDFDVDAMEAKIRKSFDSWVGEGPGLAKADEGKPSLRPSEARIFVQPGTPLRVGLNWVRAADTRADTAALRRESLIEGLALRVLNRRLDRVAATANPPFAAAGAGVGDYAASAERTSVGAVAAPGQWRRALDALSTEQRRLVRYGVTQSELQREIVDLRASYAMNEVGAATRNTRSLAEALVDSINDDEVFTTPASQFARFKADVRGLTAATVNAAVPGLFSGSGPLVYMTSPTAIAGGESALLAAFDATKAAAVGEPVARIAQAWPYKSFGAPGAVVEQRDLGADLGATIVRFANGTRLTVKPTKYKAGEILAVARFGRGRLAFAANGEPTPEWAAAGAVVEGGLGRLDWEDVQDALARNSVNVRFGIDDDRFLLSGATRPEDFGIQMGLLAAYYTDPGWRGTAWDRSRSLADTIHDGFEATPGGVFGRDSAYLLTSRDSRWMTPSRAQMKAMPIAAARDALLPSFGGAPVEVVIVGDISVDQAVRQTAATFGALAAAPAPAPAALRSAPLRFPEGQPAPVRLLHKGRADQGLAYVAWPTIGLYPDVRRSRTLSLLADILQLRLTDEIREKQGTTYSPSVGHSPSDTFDGYGYLAASIQAPPDKLAGFLLDANRIVGQLRDAPVTADELDRARRPSLANIARSRASSNGWWLSNLVGIQDDPRVAAKIRSQVADYESVTPAELQAVARAYLVDGKRWSAIVVPQASTTREAQASSGAPAAQAVSGTPAAK